MTQLIPIGNCPSFGDGLIDTMNAKDLHRGLKVGKDYTTWVKGRIESCQFQEDQDYVVFDSPVLANQVCHGGDRRSKSYFLTLDAAKHFAMLERNDQGFKVRQYFVEFEKQAKKTLPPATYQELMALADSGPIIAKHRPPQAHHQHHQARRLTHTPANIAKVPVTVGFRGRKDRQFKQSFELADTL